jgi:hypothetical protein
VDNKEDKKPFGNGRLWEPIDDQGSDQGKNKARPKGIYPRPKRTITP